MIEKSDNASADDLILMLARETVERFARGAGVNDARLAPLLLTRETFGLKYAASDDERSRFVRGTREERLALAKDAAARRWDPPSAPQAVSKVGWFASLRDLCNVTSKLREMTERPATAVVGAILSANPGVRDVDHDFSYVGYKGGSEPGILNINFLLKRVSDGKWMYLGVTLNDERRLIDQARAMGVVAAVRSFLARDATSVAPPVRTPS